MPPAQPIVPREGRAASALDQALLALPGRSDAYREERGVSRPTATRELAALERSGLLQSRGYRRAVEDVAGEPLLDAWRTARATTRPPQVDRSIRELSANLTAPPPAAGEPPAAGVTGTLQVGAVAVPGPPAAPNEDP